MCAHKSNSVTGIRLLQEWIQPALILLSLLLAYNLPFEGLFLSYAVLGPLHYLTQISWLHDRRYFFSDSIYRHLFVSLAVLLTVWLAIPAGYSPLPRPTHYDIAFVVLSLFLLPLMLNTTARRSLQLLLILCVPLIVWTLLHFDVFVLLGATLLMTFVHVAVFTLAFLLVGARRTASAASITTVCVWIFSAILVYFHPPDIYFHSLAWFLSNRPIFDPVALALGANLLHIFDSSWASAYGLLTFTFTYHYLNWFSKTELLQWHKIPLKRGISIFFLYLAAVLFYLYDYRLGFRLLLFLSALHVFLEFPLNLKTIRTLLSKNV